VPSTFRLLFPYPDPLRFIYSPGSITPPKGDPNQLMKTKPPHSTAETCRSYSSGGHRHSWKLPCRRLYRYLPGEKDYLNGAAGGGTTGGGMGNGSTGGGTRGGSPGNGTGDGSTGGRTGDGSTGFGAGDNSPGMVLPPSTSSSPLTCSKMPRVFVPTVPNTTITTTAIPARISPYSTRPCPLLSRNSLLIISTFYFPPYRCCMKPVSLSTWPRQVLLSCRQ